MLRALGYTVTSWNGAASTSPLVIGRNALKSGAKLPGDLKTFVSNGGRVLLSGQTRTGCARTWVCACRITSRAGCSKSETTPQRLDLMKLICATGVATALCSTHALITTTAKARYAGFQNHLSVCGLALG
jgi:hypothetical protein